MKISNVVLLVLLLLLVLFAGVNIDAFSAPTDLSLIFGTVTAPLGLVMLTAVGVLTLVYMLLLSRVRAASLLESHRTTKELEKARKVADNAEESRIKKLDKDLRQEIQLLGDKIDALANQGREAEIGDLIKAEGDELVERIDEIQHDLAKRIDKRDLKSG